ncbi:hypothetical protein BDZ97DRAFT_854241 [Flammula alnicola]|nr:hypothetical protein BDZ97DRAFT_854241 [Flammula alnicola]
MRKDIENGPRLFYNHIERLEQHILSSRQGVPDIDLNLYSRMLDRIRSWRLEYECSGPARSQGYPCGSCQNSNISGAPEAVYKLKILVTIAWHSSSEYWMDSTTRPHMVKRCLRPLEKLENFHDHRDGVAIHLELAVTSLAQSSYSSSLVDYLASLAGLKSGRSQVLLVALSREYPSGLSTLASAVLAYIQVSPSFCERYTRLFLTDVPSTGSVLVQIFSWVF